MTASKVDARRRPRPRDPHRRLHSRQRAEPAAARPLQEKQSSRLKKARMLTEPTMRVRGQKNLWAAGDCAAVPMAETGHEKKDAANKNAYRYKIRHVAFRAENFLPSHRAVCVSPGHAAREKHRRRAEWARRKTVHLHRPRRTRVDRPPHLRSRIFSGGNSRDFSPGLCGARSTFRSCPAWSGSCA